MNSLLFIALAISLISYGLSSDAKVKCGGPPADTSSIPQLSAEANPSMGVNSNGQETEAGYRARVNRLRLMKWKAKLARKFRRRFAH